MDRDQLVARIEKALRDDSRVRAAWLSGSLGRGVADRYSDVDLVVAVADADRDAFLTDWDTTVASIATIVLTTTVSAGPTVVFNHVTEDWLRFDVSLISPAAVARRTMTALRLLFDRDNLQATLRPAGDPLAPSGPRVTKLTKEFMRVMGLLPVVLGREEYAVGATGAGLVRGLLIQLMTEDVAVQDRGGALRLRGLLPADRLATVNALPAIEATRESVMAVHLAVARLFLPLARELHDRTGTPWPGALERALHANLDRELSLRIVD